MRSSIIKIAASLILGIIFLYQTSAQLAVTNYSNKNHVYAVNITHDTVWIGTDGGIILSDIYGTILRTITVNDSLSSNYITSIAVDSAGNKWFGTFDKGLIKYNNNKIQYFDIANTPNLGNKINCIEVEENGRVWIGTDLGVASYSGTSFDFFSTASNIQGPVISICFDGTTIWFGTATNGLYRYDGTWQKIPLASGLTGTKINAIAQKTDTLFIASEKGLFYHLKLGSTFSNYPGLSANCYSIAINPVTETPWVGSQSIIYKLSGMNYSGFTQFSMNHYPILEFDRNGIVWAGFGNLGQGVKYSNGVVSNNLVFTEPGPPTNQISCILQHNNITYFGTPSYGIIRYNNVLWDQFFTTEPNVLSLAAKNDSIYAGTANGFYIKYSVTEEFHSTTSPVNSMIVDKAGVVWFGTDNGFFNFKNNVQSNISSSGLFRPSIRAIAVDKLNTKWFLHSDGLTRYDGTTFAQFSIANMGIPGAELFDIAVDTLGNIWIASSAGVINYNGNTFANYTQIDGLPENKILSVFVDDKNIKYFGTASNGLSIFNGSGFKNIGRNKYRLATNKITSINGEKFSNNIWLSGDYGGISQLYISPITVSIMPQGPTPICPGSSIQLNAYFMGGLFPDQIIFSWTAHDGSINSRAPSIIVTPKSTTTYYLQAGDGVLRDGSAYLIDIIQFEPSIIAGPQTVCSNVPSVLYSVPFDIDRNYSWNIQGGTLDNNITSDVYATWDFSASTWQLNLSEYNINNGCSISQQFPISVDFLSQTNLVRKGENLLICKDSGMVTYDWFLNEIPITAPNRQFLYLDNTLASSSGRYSVGITSKYGCNAISNGIDIIYKNTSLYPNPTKKLINIEYYNDEPFHGYIEIRDIQGLLIQQTELPPGEGAQKITFDITNFRTGTYFYQIVNEEKKFASGKFVKD